MCSYPALLESDSQIPSACLKFEGSEDPATWNNCSSRILQARPIWWASAAISKVSQTQGALSETPEGTLAIEAASLLKFRSPEKMMPGISWRTERETQE